MKKETTETKTICDFCCKKECWDKCLRCGRDVCWECKETAGVEYRHSVYAQGSGDGFYCSHCNTAMEQNPDHLFCAYKAIRTLRQESDSYLTEFESRRKTAEATLARILRRHTAQTTDFAGDEGFGTKDA